MIDNLNGWEKIINNDNTRSNQSNKMKPQSVTNYIFVLSGGLSDNYEPHRFVKTRLDKAIQIYKHFKCNNQTCIIIVFGGGTYHKPPQINQEKYVVHESSACANYLYNHNISPDHIYREWSSYDTIANGYYAFLNFVQPLNIMKCCLITSDFHITRVKTIFNYFNNLIYNNNLEIEYISVPNTDIAVTILDERLKREHNSNMSFKQNIVSNKKTLSAFTSWFYSEHKAYKAILSYTNNVTINHTY